MIKAHRYILPAILLGSIVFMIVNNAQSKAEYYVALEFSQTKNLMKMSDSTFSSYVDCVESSDYRLLKVVGDTSGSNYICTDSKPKY